MGGPSQSSINTQNQLTQEQIGIAQTQQQQSAADTAQRQALEAPAIGYNTAITSGDKNTAFSAIAPLVSSISNAGEQARGQIMEQIPAGPGRDVALSQNTRNTYSQIASAANTAYTGAFDKLANIGSGIGSFALNELGGALSGLSGASSSNNAVIQAGAQQKSSTMGFLGELAGAAGTAATGHLGCWIAEAIYGIDNWRTHLLRAWLNGPFRDRWYGRIVMFFYRTFGFTIAKQVRKYWRLKATLRPLFDMALRHAMEYETAGR